MKAAGGDVIGLDWRVPIDRCWESLGSGRGVQGNLDPAVLLGPGSAWRPRPTASSTRSPAGAGTSSTSATASSRHRPGRPRPARRARPRAHLRRSHRLTADATRTAVILMAYGSPERPEDIPAYFSDIRGGRPVRQEAVDELTERYRRIGGTSPLNRITEAQRAALEEATGLPVYVGMKHWHPWIGGRRAGARRRSRAAGRARARAPLLAHLDRRLPRAARGGARRPRRARLRGELARPRAYVDLLAERVRGTDAHVVFTAHSLPERILAEGDPYRDQLLETSRLVADRAGVSDWSFAFQSESPTGEPWLGPDILVELETLHAAACARCWSLPSASSATTSRSSGTSTSRPAKAAELGLELDRIESPNADPAFIRALADLVEKASGAERRIGVR